MVARLGRGEGGGGGFCLLLMLSHAPLGNFIASTHPSLGPMSVCCLGPLPVASVVVVTQVVGPQLPQPALAAYFGSAPPVAALAQSVASSGVDVGAVHSLVSYTLGRLCPHVPLQRGQVFVVPHDGEKCVFRVEHTVPPGPVVVNPDTVVRVQ
jgi:hypothetical protein